MHSTHSAAISDAAASLAPGFSSLEGSFESGWHSWVNDLNAPPASVTGSAGLKEQYYVSLMELKADEDKTYVRAFVASPTDLWGTSVSANNAGDRSYQVVWTRDEYEMASALLAAGHSTDANDALQYIFNYEEVQRRGQKEHVPDKHDQGGSWNNVEETSSCGYVANRDLGFDAANTSDTANTVAAWKGSGAAEPAAPCVPPDTPTREGVRRHSGGRTEHRSQVMTAAMKSPTSVSGVPQLLIQDTVVRLSSRR